MGGFVEPFALKPRIASGLSHGAPAASPAPPHSFNRVRFQVRLDEIVEPVGFVKLERLRAHRFLVLRRCQQRRDALAGGVRLVALHIEPRTLEDEILRRTIIFSARE